MNKKYVIFFLMFILFYSTELVAFSYPSFTFSIINNTEKKIFLTNILYPEYYDEGNGYSLNSIKGIMGVGFQLFDHQIYEIDSLEQCGYYNINRHGREQRWFASLGPYEHFKLFYKEFTIKNEQGEVLFDLTTMTSESFIKENDLRYYLVID